MGIATDIAIHIGLTQAGKFDYLRGYGNTGVQVAVFYGDGKHERTTALGKVSMSEHVQIQIKYVKNTSDYDTGNACAKNDINYAAMEGVADKIMCDMQGYGAVPLSGIIGLEENKLALEYKVLNKNTGEI
jgi:hypothetical protein